MVLKNTYLIIYLFCSFVKRTYLMQICNLAYYNMIDFCGSDEERILYQRMLKNKNNYSSIWVKNKNNYSGI